MEEKITMVEASRLVKRCFPEIYKEGHVYRVGTNIADNSVIIEDEGDPDNKYIIRNGQNSSVDIVH